MPYAMYLRKSRADDPHEEVAEVLAKHRKLLFELAEGMGVSPAAIDTYEEVVSGESLYARPKMLQLLEQVEAGAYTGVFCADIDRLGRGAMSEQGVILEAFRLSETLIICPGKTYDLTNDLDEEQTEMKSFFARMELRMIRKRMRRGLMQTIQAGGYVANAPYGYRKCTVGKLPSLEIDETQAPFIRHIFNRYLEGVGAHIIADELNAMGSVPNRNARWCRSTVRQILRNPTYAGKVAWNRVKHYRADKTHPHQRVVYMPMDQWILVDGVHPAIIPWEDWEQVQQIRQSRSIPSSNHGQVANPLAGLIVCGNCGFNMVRMGQNKGDPRLLCNTKGCIASARFDRVEARLLADLGHIRDELTLEARQAKPPDTRALEAQLRGVRNQIHKLGQRKSRLYDLLEDGTYDRDTFRERMARAEQEEAELQAKKDELDEKVREARGLRRVQIISLLTSALDLYPTLDAAGKNQLLKSIVDKVIYRKEKKSKPTDFSLEIHLKTL